MYKLIFTALFGAFVLKGSSQTKILHGYLVDSFTRLPIPGGTIVNAHSKLTVHSDANGYFSIPVKPDDVLFAIAKQYVHDTLHYSLLFNDTLQMLLAPAGDILENITISSGYERYKADSLERRAEFEKARGTTYHAINTNRHEGFGVQVNLDRFLKSKYKKQQKEEKLFNETEKQAYIDSRFSPLFVSYYTGLKGAALAQFMRINRPEYYWLRTHPYREQLLDYLSEKLKESKTGNRPT